MKIYNYHYLDRVIPVGKVAPQIQDLRLWNLEVSNILRTLGPNKQANIVILLTDLPRDYYYSVVKVWKHGKKNDIIVMIGLGPDQEVKWAEVCSWSKKDIFNVKLRDSLMEIPKLDREKIITTINEITKSDFQRRSMKEFEYLKKEIQIPTGLGIIIIVLVIGSWVGVHFLVVKVQEESSYQNSVRRRFR